MTASREYRTGGNLHARRQEVLGVARGPRAPLAELGKLGGLRARGDASAGSVGYKRAVDLAQWDARQLAARGWLPMRLDGLLTGTESKPVRWSMAY